jgi:hypothetical protein
MGTCKFPFVGWHGNLRVPEEIVRGIQIANGFGRAPAFARRRRIPGREKHIRAPVAPMGDVIWLVNVNTPCKAWRMQKEELHVPLFRADAGDSGTPMKGPRGGFGCAS